MLLVDARLQLLVESFKALDLLFFKLQLFLKLLVHGNYSLLLITNLLTQLLQVVLVLANLFLLFLFLLLGGLCM